MKAKKIQRPHVELTPAELKERWDKKREHVGQLVNNIQRLKYNITQHLGKYIKK